jgi:hypothetical protein
VRSSDFTIVQFQFMWRQPPRLSRQSEARRPSLRTVDPTSPARRRREEEAKEEEEEEEAKEVSIAKSPDHPITR